MAELRGSLIPEVDENTITGLIRTMGTDGAAYSQLFEENQRPLFAFCEVVARHLLPEKPRQAQAFVDVTSLGYLALEKAISGVSHIAQPGVQGIPWVADPESHRQRLHMQPQFLMSDYVHAQPTLSRYVRGYGRNSGLEGQDLLELSGVAAFVHNTISYELEYRVLNSWYYGPSSVDRLLDGTDEVY